MLKNVQTLPYYNIKIHVKKCSNTFLVFIIRYSLGYNVIIYSWFNTKWTYFLWNVLQIVVCHFVLFLLAIVLSVLRFKNSDYPFGIFKLYFLSYIWVRTSYLMMRLLWCLFWIRTICWVGFYNNSSLKQHSSGIL
jgi:hypothetical protein